MEHPKIIIYEKGDHKNADAEFLAGPCCSCLKKWLSLRYQGHFTSFMLATFLFIDALSLCSSVFNPFQCKHFKIFLIFKNFYLFLRQRETRGKWGRGRGRGRHRIWNRLQAPNCQHRARSQAWTQGLWDCDLSRSQTFNWLSHRGCGG